VHCTRKKKSHMDLFSSQTLGLSAGGWTQLLLPGWLLARLSAKYVRLCGPGAWEVNEILFFLEGNPLCLVLDYTPSILKYLLFFNIKIN
jgi:hypothetical protein